MNAVLRMEIKQPVKAPANQKIVKDVLATPFIGMIPVMTEEMKFDPVMEMNAV